MSPAIPPQVTPDTLKALIRLELPEAEALALLQECTPERVSLDLLTEALACMQESAAPVALPDSPVLDCCGTGGSGLSHFNTSTTVALVLAAGGVPVVKFGNRGFSSASGSFDLLAQLGIGHNLNPQRLPEVLDACGVAFLFAPTCYPALAGFAKLRQQLKTRTLFNFLGPLLNPVKPAYRLLGVSHSGMQFLMAEHLSTQEHCEQAWVVHGADGLDEIAIHGPTQLLTVSEQQVQASELLPLGDLSPLPSGDHSPQENLTILHRLLQAEDEQSPYYQLVCLNAAAGFVIAGHASTLADGYKEAQALLKSGQVLSTLKHCRSAHERFV